MFVTIFVPLIIAVTNALPADLPTNLLDTAFEINENSEITYLSDSSSSSSTSKKAKKEILDSEHEQYFAKLAPNKQSNFANKKGKLAQGRLISARKKIGNMRNHIRQMHANYQELETRLTNQIRENDRMNDEYTHQMRNCQNELLTLGSETDQLRINLEETELSLSQEQFDHEVTKTNLETAQQERQKAEDEYYQCRQEVNDLQEFRQDAENLKIQVEDLTKENEQLSSELDSTKDKLVIAEANAAASKALALGENGASEGTVVLEAEILELKKDKSTLELDLERQINLNTKLQDELDIKENDLEILEIRNASCNYYNLEAEQLRSVLIQELEVSLNNDANNNNNNNVDCENEISEIANQLKVVTDSQQQLLSEKMILAKSKKFLSDENQALQKTLDELAEDNKGLRQNLEKMIQKSLTGELSVTSDQIAGLQKTITQTKEQVEETIAPQEQQQQTTISQNNLETIVENSVNPTTQSSLAEIITVKIDTNADNDQDEKQDAEILADFEESYEDQDDLETTIIDDKAKDEIVETMPDLGK